MYMSESNEWNLFPVSVRPLVNMQDVKQSDAIEWICQKEP